MIEHEELEANPGLVEGLPKDLRAVAVSGGDNVGVAIGSNGLVKPWDSFHVRSLRLIGYCMFLRFASFSLPLDPLGLKILREQIGSK